MRTRTQILHHNKELETIWDDLEKIKPNEVVPIEQPPDLFLPLLPFQKYGVGWMLQQESMKAVKYPVYK
jgi:DNA repair protein RAD16